LKWGAAVQHQASSNVNSLFGEATESVISDTPRLPLCDEWGLMEKLQKEKDVVGLYLSGHPLDDYREEIQTFTSCSLPNLDRFRGQEVKVAGIVSEVRHGVTRKGTGWGAFKIQDFEGTIELALFNDDYMKFSHYFVQNQTLFLNAKYMPRWNDNTTYELKLNDVQLLAGLGERLISTITLELNYPDLDERMITDLYMLCTMHPGKHKLKFKLAGLPDNSPVNLSSKTVLVNINDALRAEVKRLGIAYTLA
jgi:DNA polymerase III subunit alpha